MFWQGLVALAYVALVVGWFAHRQYVEYVGSILYGLATVAAGYWAGFYSWLFIFDPEVSFAATWSRVGHVFLIGFFVLFQFELLETERHRRAAHARAKRGLEELLAGEEDAKAKLEALLSEAREG